MPARDLVVVGASAGGVEALTRFVRELPRDLAAAVLVVLHMPPNSVSNLALILRRAGPLDAVTAVDGAKLHTGLIQCAPPDHHLSVADGRVRVHRGPHENLHRPSVDVLFRSAAVAHDGRTCGIVLSGALDDGASGLRAIRSTGGLALVQDPADALVPSMPVNAIRAASPDQVLPADELGRQLARLLSASVAAGSRTSKADAMMRQEVAMTALEVIDGTPPGKPSPFGCPDCGGVLWEIDDGGDPRFRCRTGHAYTARSLMAAEHAGLEDALWAALRALEEQESLSRRMLDRGWARGGDRIRQRLETRAAEAHRRAAILREFLLSPIADPDPDGDGALSPDRENGGRRVASTRDIVETERAG